MSFRDRLKEARIAKGFKQIELSEKIGMSKNAVSNYENGSSNPNVDVLYKIFEVLEIDPNFLFQDEVPIHNTVLTSDEKDLIEQYRKLNVSGQKRQKEYIRLLSLDDKYTKLRPMPSETQYEQAAFGGKGTHGTYPKITEEST